MATNVTPLRTNRQPPRVEPDRGEWGALRAELHSRCADEDLAALWAELATGERRAVLASAKLDPSESLTPLEQQPHYNRQAIRAAIHRMSQYANRLRDRLHGERPHPSRELAANARHALEQGNTRDAMHWLALIEKGVA